MGTIATFNIKALHLFTNVRTTIKTNSTVKWIYINLLDWFPMTQFATKAMPIIIINLRCVELLCNTTRTWSISHTGSIHMTVFRCGHTHTYVLTNIVEKGNFKKSVMQQLLADTCFV